MEAGKVKTIVVDKATGKRKGFGFIEPDGGGDQIFFHRSAIKNADFDAVNAGDTVTYDAENSDKGPRAENVNLT
jgi:CspA family cold shock protein